jgi:predicted PolB exonuclease-like 3'-5' exonuclease
MTLGSVLAFDIETVPDVEFGRRVYGLEGLSDKQVGYVMQTHQREKVGSEFLSLEQHRVVAISVAMRSRDGFRVWSLGEAGATEDALVRLFFDAVERFTPTLVSWNGSAFDLPVLHYRAMRHGVQARRYWETGEEDPAFRWNNYINRFHWRHVDLMDVMSGFQARGRVTLDGMAQLLGLPGKMGMSGDEVWSAYLDGRHAAIREYCETDVLNTYLIYLRFELMRGRLDHSEYEAEAELVRTSLAKTGQPHIATFLAAWEKRGA